MLPENRSFLIRGDDGHEYGPVDLTELREWVAENRAGLGTEVRHDDDHSAWHPWQNYPELVALLAEVQVMSPAPSQSGLVIAPIWRRMVAWLIDILLLDVLLIPLRGEMDHVMTMNQIIQAITDPTVLQNLPIAVLYKFAALVIIDNACMVLYFAMWHAVLGKTPGKALLFVRVVDASGQKPTPIKAFVRALALILSLSFLFPLIYVFFNPQRRTLHDLVAGTYVVEA